MIISGSVDLIFAGYIILVVLQNGVGGDVTSHIKSNGSVNTISNQPTPSKGMTSFNPVDSSCFTPVKLPSVFIDCTPLKLDSGVEDQVDKRSMCFCFNVLSHYLGQ